MAILESKLNRNEAFERQAEHWRGEIAKLRGEEETIRLGGGVKAQEKQRAQGKMTARERVAALPRREWWWGSAPSMAEMWWWSPTTPR